MHRRQPLPRLWLMTDERQGEALWTALERLPRGSGLVFRHYGLAPKERQALFERVRRIARKRRLLLLVGGAALRGADGLHGSGPGRLSAPVHGLGELRAAEKAGAHLVFVSPVFATRSHPGARPLGQMGLARLAAAARVPVIALGGMDKTRARSLAGLNVYGWAAIDAWSR
jgi:thiamine-phosphate pyrophosphorylase